MSSKSKAEQFRKLHAIQPRSMNVVELYIHANQQPDLSVEYDQRAFSLVVGHSDYNAEEKSIQVLLKLEIGMDDQKETSHPFSMKIELIADFLVNEDDFPIEQIDDWAKRNAPIILYPFIREHAFALSARCGFRPILLPLITVPTLTLKETEA